MHSFSGNGLDRAANKRLDEAWLQAHWDNSDSRYVCFAADRPMVLIGAEGDAPQIYLEHRADPDAELSDAVFLGLDDTGRASFAIALALDDDGVPRCGVADGIKLIDLRSLAAQGVLTPSDLGVLAQARSMLGWHQTHGFCATCGAASVTAEGGYKRKCPACGREHFPRTDPVVIMVVRDGDKCLLGRGGHFPEGSYSALAGFVEPGETIEEAARREIFEESGIVVGDVHYHSSQPWPFPSSLMIGLIGEAVTRDLKIDYEELQDARWFSLAEMEQMLGGTHPEGLFTPPPLAIAHHLVKACVQAS